MDMRGITEKLREEAAYHAYVVEADPKVASDLRRLGFWSQKEIGERVGCSRQYIHLLEQTALKKARLGSAKLIKEHGTLRR
jgi:transcriptional regulator